ncbi:MAG: Membrane-bound lytic murein transglycosylase precursor [Pseudomonadota bacterium]|jgi:membrane-bound lytic murein transglycosylase B
MPATIPTARALRADAHAQTRQLPPQPARLRPGLLALGLAMAWAGATAPALAKGREKSVAAHATAAKSHHSGKASKHHGGAHGKVAHQAGSAAERYAGNAAAQELAHEIALRRGWDEAWVQHWLAEAQKLPSVIRLIAPPPSVSAKNWSAYRARFIEPGRIAAGVGFWLAHKEELARAEAVYGVPAWLVVGIIGVETLYGRHTGSFRTLDALATLSLDFPASHPRAAERQAFFRGELETLLQLSREQGVPPDQWRGSYAGAMGLPQFMPGSWQKFAVDFDGDGRIDLRNSPADAIGSVANYLKQYGWQSDMPTHYPVNLGAEGAELATLLAPDILPTFPVERFQALGARLDTPAQQHRGPLALIELLNGDPLQGGSAPSYVAGTENFYVVTRYNWSSYYALAVIELGQAVQAALPR